MASTSRNFDAPDPDGLDLEELADAYDQLLRRTCGASVSWYTRYGLTAQALEGEAELDVWTSGAALAEIERYVERQTGQDIDVYKFADDYFQRQLIAILNALDADVQRVLKGGDCDEIEEVYLGLRRVKNEEPR